MSSKRNESGPTIPRGIEVLVKKASVDPAFRALLLKRRSAAAGEIGLELQEAEATMLDIVPAGHLEAIIARTRVEPGKKPAFLGKAAAVMLVALGASQLDCEKHVEGHRPKGSTTSTAPTSIVPAKSTLAIELAAPLAAGLASVDQTTASQPATSPATQPASSPAALRERIMPLLKQLDSDVFKERDGAQKELQSLGVDALQPLREILKGEKLSVEVANRIKTAMWDIKGTTRPALVNPPEPTPFPAVIAGLLRNPEPVRTENPED